MPVPVIYFCAALLFIGAAPLPYGYYSFMRLAVCVFFAIAAYVTFERGSKILPWTFGALILLFNPIVKVHLPKEAWAVVDIAAGVFVLFTAKYVRAREDARPE